MGPVKWYLRPVSIVVALLAIGPFAIPLVWISPAFKRWQKVLITILIAALTLWLLASSVQLYQTLLADLRQLQEALAK